MKLIKMMCRGLNVLSVIALTTIAPCSLVAQSDTTDITLEQPLSISDVMPPQQFKPNSTKAVLLALVPGMGQIYNRKYWKLPIVYGAFMGCFYAIAWNGNNYQDYQNAYKSILHDSEVYTQLQQDSQGQPVEYQFDKAWTDLVTSTNYASLVNNVQYHNLFKSRKDFFRRNRDLSIIISVGVYLISLVDAYVDAEMFDFDISPDLSMRVTPTASPATRTSPSNIGLNWSITF